MIRGAGRLDKRMDTRAAFSTPGEDAVRDGRHLMPQEAPVVVDEVTDLPRHVWNYLLDRLGVPLADEIERMEDEGGLPC